MESYNAQLYTLKGLVDEEAEHYDSTLISNEYPGGAQNESTQPPTSYHHPTTSDDPRGRTQDRQFSPEVYIHSKRKASHSPDSLLYHEDEGTLPVPDATSGGLYLPVHHAYKYRTLSRTDVRLLRISPGTFDDGLQCALKHIPLTSLQNNILEFQALSYAWGEKGHYRIIHVHDILSEGIRTNNPLLQRLRIRSNLYSALRRIREEDSDTWLWVDALCIDQSNEDEKSEQIPHMPDIYSNAWNVVVWLGNASYHGYGTQSIVKLLPQVLNLKALDAMLRTETVDTHISHSLSEFCGLLSRPWFNRRWVIQEIACARRLSVRFGSHVLSWVDFTDAIELILDHLDLLRDICLPSVSPLTSHSPLHTINVAGLQALLHLSRNVFRKTCAGKIISRLMNLESLIVAASSFEVTEPRDIVYSLLYLATDVSGDGSSPQGDSSSFVADYSKLALETFFDFIRLCIQTQASLDIILRPWLNYSPQRRNVFFTPSWMKFCFPRVGHMKGFIGHSAGRAYNASQGVAIAASLERDLTGSRPCFRSQSGYSDNLLASGVVVGVIKRVATSVSELVSDQCLRLLGWTGDLADGVPERLWRTLVANRTQDHKPAPAWYRRACALALTQLDEDGNLDYCRLRALGEQPDTVLRYVERVQNVAEGRAFFSCEASEEGRSEIVGLASGAIRKGDYICILYGCSVPVVLRGNIYSRQIVRLHGQAYVHGLMEGELFGGKTQ